MGYATTRSLERVAAAMGELESAPIAFEAAADIPEGGVLLALPALLATGLLRHTPAFYDLPKGYYGIDSIFLLLAMMALARVASIEQLRYIAPGEWAICWDWTVCRKCAVCATSWRRCAGGRDKPISGTRS